MRLFTTLILFTCCLLSLQSRAQISGLGTNGTTYGINRINTRQNTSSGASVTGENIVITRRGSIKGDLTIRKSHLHFNEPSENRFITYSPSDADEEASRNLVITDASSISVKLRTTRKNMNISELSKKSRITQIGGTGNLFVYTETGAKLNDCLFQDVYVVECNGSPSEFYKVVLKNTGIGMLNWKAGRIDRYGIDIPSTTTGWDSWLGSGGSGENSIWDWNPKNINANKIVHQSTRSRYYQGVTSCYKFIDQTTSRPVYGIKVIWKDDRLNPGLGLVKRAEYRTDFTGVMRGSVDSRTLNTGALQQRPVLHVLTHATLPFNFSQSTGLTEPSISYYYRLQDITTELDVRGYLYLPAPSSSINKVQQGEIDHLNRPTKYAAYFLAPDPNVTETNTTTVALYRSVQNTNQLYDILKLYWFNQDQYPFVGVKGTTLILPDGWSLKLDENLAGISPVWVQPILKQITVRSSKLEPTENINRLRAPTGTVSFANSEIINFPYTDKNSDAYVRLVGLASSDRIRVWDGGTLRMDRTGEQGLPYRSGGGNMTLRVNLQDGTEIQRLFPKTGTGLENRFSVSFNSGSHKDFLQADRLTLNEIANQAQQKLEDRNSLIEIIRHWLMLHVKQHQTVP